VLEEGAAAAPAPAAKAADAGSKPATSSAAPTAGNEDQSPAVRKLLSELGLSASQISGSGKGGRLTVEDVKAYADKPKPAAKAEPAKAAAAPAAPRAAGSREEQRVPMTRIRTRIAERLLEAKNSTAMLTTFNEVDLKAVSELRARYKDVFEKTHGVKLGFMSFFIKATLEALKKYPVLNASVDGNDIIYHGYYDIGVAVSSERGLVVPILRDADLRSMADIEKAIGDFGSRAKANKLTMDDLTGGTFSVTNGGVFGSMMSTPILNPPQSAILGMHGITERPVVVNGEIVIRPMMYLALSYDHRIIDGKEAVLGLRTIKECLEDPAKLLLSL
jgi:2-oxoglutarate dehydrogenase E2 component (dihydrolipoamide succinyltransferase)